LQFIVDVYVEEGHRMLCCFFTLTDEWDGSVPLSVCSFLLEGNTLSHKKDLNWTVLLWL